MAARGFFWPACPAWNPPPWSLSEGASWELTRPKWPAAWGRRFSFWTRTWNVSDISATSCPPNCFLLASSPAAIRDVVKKADVVIGAVLIPGAKAPKLVTRDMLATMKEGAVLVDVAIDQGGCFETSRPTTHKNPIYTVDGVVHYCVANMPGAVPKTSTIALTNATLPYALEIADKGWKRAMKENPEIAKGANVVRGAITHPGVADAFGLAYVPVDALIA